MGLFEHVYNHRPGKCIQFHSESISSCITPEIKNIVNLKLVDGANCVHPSQQRELCCLQLGFKPMRPTSLQGQSSNQHIRYQIIITADLFQIQNFAYWKLYVVQNSSAPRQSMAVNDKEERLNYTTSSIASFPGCSHLQYLIACSTRIWRAKAWEIRSHSVTHGGLCLTVIIPVSC